MSFTLLSLLTLALPAVAQKLTFTQGAQEKKSDAQNLTVLQGSIGVQGLGFSKIRGRGTYYNGESNGKEHGK